LPVHEERPEGLSIQTSQPSPGVVLVELAGEADILSADGLLGRIDELATLLPAHVVFDLSGLTFMDSSGINALVRAVRSVEDAGGSAVVTEPTPDVRRVFEIIGLSQVVSFVSRREDALQPPPPNGDSGLADAVQ
jgi:anti-anti-sigma factor